MAHTDWDQKWADLEEFYAKTHRPSTDKEKSIRTFELYMFKKEPSRLKALRRKYGVLTKNEKCELKWQKLELFYSKFGRCPLASRPEELGLVEFSGGTVSNHPARLSALRKKYGIKTIFDR